MASTKRVSAKKAPAKKASAKKAPARKAPAKKAPVKKASAKKAVKKAPTKEAKTPKLKGSAGPRILGDLGLTDAELFAFLPPDAPKWVLGVFWCQFECDATLEDLMRHFGERYEVSLDTSPRFPEGGPPEGIPVRTLTLRPKGKYVAYMFYGMRGTQYVEDGSFQLEAAFHASGTSWGSNRAVYERFKALELPKIGARNILERTGTD